MDYLSRRRHGRKLRIRHSKSKKRSGYIKIYSSSLCVALRAAVAKRKKHQNRSSHTHPRPDSCSVSVTIGTTGIDYLIRIFTYKNYTPLSAYLLMLEMESMEVMNVTAHNNQNKLFYAIAVNTSKKSQLEIDLLRHKLYRLASTKCQSIAVEWPQKRFKQQPNIQ